MELQLDWWLTKDKLGALLTTKEPILDTAILHKVFIQIKNARFNGHKVLYPPTINQDRKSFYMRKWRHFEWHEVCTAVEQSIKEQLPKIVFKNTIKKTTP